MKTFERILAATDPSPASQPALDEAERIARECGSRLWILHAYQIPPLASIGRHGLLMGSVASRVVCRSPRAVLTVRCAPAAGSPAAGV